MGQNQRQKNMAGRCTLDMRGSNACALIRGIESRDLEPEIRKHDDGTFVFWHSPCKCIAFSFEHNCDVKCGLQDVCARLEMALRLRDLDELSVSIDSGAYSRNERMGVRDAGADGHADEAVEMGAGGIFADYSNECDDTWDCLGDPCMVLWAGDPGITCGGAGVVQPQEVGSRMDSQPSTAVKEKPKKALKFVVSSDSREQNSMYYDRLMDISMAQQEALIRNKVIYILDMCFGYHFLNIKHSETLIERMKAEGFMMFSLEGFYKDVSLYNTNPLTFRVDSFLDHSKIYIYHKKTGVAYNLCGIRMDEELLKKINELMDKYEEETEKD